MNQRLLGVWKYDDDIGYLCGEIEEILEDGRIKVKGYDGSCFEPVQIIPYKDCYRQQLSLLRLNLAEGKKKLITKYKTEFENLVQLNTKKFEELVGIKNKGE